MKWWILVVLLITLANWSNTYGSIMSGEFDCSLATYQIDIVRCSANPGAQLIGSLFGNYLILILPVQIIIGIVKGIRKGQSSKQSPNQTENLSS